MTRHKANAASNSSDRKKRILLVVDSDDDHLFFTATLLKRFDYHVLTAKSAEEAVHMAKDIVPSLIISSLGLKDMDGLELIQHFKKDPSLLNVPLIALRKEGDLDGERMCLELGAIDCLYHPVDAETLYRVVQIVVEKKPRTHMRVRTLQPVQMNKKLPVSFENACALDLSEHGMFLQTTEPAAANSRVSLQIDLNGHIIPIETMVVYSYRKPGGPYLQTGMGLEFVQIKLADQEFIRRFIRQEVTKGLGLGNAW